MQNKIKATVWSQPGCKWCVAAVNLLAKYPEYEINEKKEWSRIEFDLATLNARTIPQIFIGEEYVGGFEALQKYLNKRHESRDSGIA